MRQTLIILITAMLFFATGCSTMLSLKFDGEKWSLGIGGEVPQIPLIDYEKELN